MKWLRPVYERAMVWAGRPRALGYLGGLSFIEAFIFPIAPEVMLLPMALAKPRRAFRYANVSLACSLLGSLVGYALGHYAFHALSPWLADLHLLDPINAGVSWLRARMDAHWWSLLLVLMLAALQPLVPMKFITWAAGVVGVPLGAFLLCMAVGRGKRVYLLALLVRWFGARAEEILHRHIERFGWAAVVVLALLGVWWFGFR